MKYDFKELVILDIEDQRVDTAEMCKGIGNLIFQNSRDISVSDIAREIYKGNTVEIDSDSKKQIITIIELPGLFVVAHVKKALKLFLEEG